MKIALCLPTGDDVKTDFCMSLVGVSATTDAEMTIVNARTSIIEQSRFIITREALKREPDYLFWWDSDIGCPPDSLNRLLAYNKDIVGATYIRRRDPYNILGFTLDGEEISPGQKGLARMARMPFGFLLIKAEVFSKIPKPWFQPWFDPEADSWTSEDYVFSDHARHVGYELFVDLDLSHEIGHIGAQCFWWNKPKVEEVETSIL